MSTFENMLSRARHFSMLTALVVLYSLPAQGKDAVISSASSYVIQGEPINVDAVAINAELSEQKPLTLLVYEFTSRRWISLGSSHSDNLSGFAKVTGNKVLFTHTDSRSFGPGSRWFGVTRSCTANGICPLDVEPDEAVRVIIAQ